MPEITDENYIKARNKVVDTILKDPDAYKQLQLANFKAVKAMDEDLKMKEVKPDNLRDKPNEMKVIKKDAKGNTEDTLGKKERKKSKDAGIKQMTQTPKKAKGIAKVMEVPGKEKVKALRENIMAEMTKINPEHEHFQVGARVKKKDNSLVGEITEWDGDTATIKTDEGKIVHVQGNIITKKDVPSPKEEAAQTGTSDEWASGKTEKKATEGYMGTPYNSSEDMAVDMVNKGIKEEKIKSLKEKLTKMIRGEVAKVTDEDGTVVALKANPAAAQQFIQGQDPAVKSKLKVTGS
jgi:hypothetical protein